MWLWHIITERGQSHLFKLRLSPGPELHPTNPHCSARLETLGIFLLFIPTEREGGVTEWLHKEKKMLFKELEGKLRKEIFSHA